MIRRGTINKYENGMLKVARKLESFKHWEGLEPPAKKDGCFRRPSMLQW